MVNEPEVSGYGFLNLIPAIYQCTVFYEFGHSNSKLSLSLFIYFFNIFIGV